MKTGLYFLITLLTIINSATGQTPAKRFRSSGAMVGYGIEFSDNIDYRIRYFTGDFSGSFRVPKKKVFLAWYAEPQVNLVKTNTTPDRKLDYEAGINLGLRNYIKISDGFYLYQMLGSGPHFITAKMERQARGFIFSDNLALGGFIRLRKNPWGRKDLFLNMQAGIRHISNAGLKLPNKGVNTYTLRLGLSYIR